MPVLTAKNLNYTIMSTVVVGAGVPEPGLNRWPEKPKIRGRT